MYRVCSAVTIFTSVLTIAMQVPFLSSQKTTSVQNLFFYLSLAFASLKFLVSAVSYATKASQAAHISDECEEESEGGSEGKGGDMELATIYGKAEEEGDGALSAHVKPLHAANTDLHARDTDSLLMMAEADERLQAQEQNSVNVDKRLALLEAERHTSRRSRTEVSASLFSRNLFINSEFHGPLSVSYPRPREPLQRGGST